MVRREGHGFLVWTTSSTILRTPLQDSQAAKRAWMPTSSPSSTKAVICPANPSLIKLQAAATSSIWPKRAASKALSRSHPATKTTWSLPFLSKSSQFNVILELPASTYSKFSNKRFLPRSLIKTVRRWANLLQQVKLYKPKNNNRWSQLATW